MLTAGAPDVSVAMDEDVMWLGGSQGAYLGGLK